MEDPSFLGVEMKGWVFGTSPELWGKCRECQSKAELRAGKKALDGGCALERALSLPAFFSCHFCATLPNFGAASRGSFCPCFSWASSWGALSFGGAEKQLAGALSPPRCWERSSPGRCFSQLGSHGAPPFLCALLMSFCWGSFPSPLSSPWMVAFGD